MDIPWRLWAKSRRLGIWGSLGALTFLVEVTLGTTRVPLPRLGQLSVEIPPTTLLSTLLPIAAASVCTLNSDVYVGGVGEVERTFARWERAGFGALSGLWWVGPAVVLLTHSPHPGVVSYLAALSILVPLTWAASAVLGSQLSWLPTIVYDLAALAAGSDPRGHPYWWDWWRADSLSRSAWFAVVASSLLTLMIFVWWGPRRRVSDIDV